MKRTKEENKKRIGLFVEQWKDILKDKPVAYRPDIAKALGSVKAAVFLSQLGYWMPRGHKENWIYKTQKDWYEETGLSRKEQETARRILKQRKIIAEKIAGIPAKVHYQINLTKFTEVMSDYYKKNQEDEE